MHELAIARNIVELVTEAARGRRVHRITLEIGKLSGVAPECVAFCFPEVARGTPVEAAELEIREIEGRARCESCGGEFPLPDLTAICPCGSLHLRPVTGEELSVKCIEVEEAC